MIHRLCLSAAAVAALLCLSACTTAEVLSQPEPGNAVDETAIVLPMVNALRARHGLAPLQPAGEAARAAADQANRMARIGVMQHNIGLGSDFGRRMRRMGVVLPAAENIAAQQQTPDRAFDAWLHSPHHLANMLGPYKGIGVAVSQNSASAGVPYWSMVLSN